MKEKFLPASLLDGGVRAALLWVLTEFSVSALLTDWKLDIYIAPLICAGVFALVSGTLSWLLLRRFSQRKTLVFYGLASLGWFLLGFIFLFLNYMTLKLRLFPVRALGLGDGLMLLFETAGFAFGSGLLRLICLAVLFFRRKPSDAV